MPSIKDVEKVCQECGRTFLIRRSDAKRGLGTFCSTRCQGKNAAKNYLPIGKSGIDNPNWKGGLTLSTKGYWYVKQPEHHRALKCGYVKRATLVMEALLGRSLDDDEFVHHINENKTDDSASNLEVVNHTIHNRIHHSRDRVPRVLQPDHPHNRRYIWPTDEQLISLRQTSSLRIIASAIGCSHKSVDRRIQRIQRRQKTMGR